MKPVDFLICLIGASGNVVYGRTMLQKLAFFVSLDPELRVDLGYTPYFYGPFSPVLHSALGDAQALGFVDEQTTGFGYPGAAGFEVRRHDYRLTEHGKKIAESIERNQPEAYQRIVAGVQRIREAGDPNYFELSLAAKTFFVISKKNRPLTHEEVLQTARDFNWSISPESLQRAVSFLEKLRLVQTVQEAPAREMRAEG